jgi:hypothetical protein
VGPRAPWGTHDEADRSADEIVVFPTGRTIARAGSPSEEPTPEASGDVGARALALEARRPFHARPGHRLGATPGTTSGRAGGHTDIVRPLLVPPGTASRIVLAGEVFEMPLPHFRIESDRFDARLLVWAVAIVGERERPVPATLHLLGSPSMIVTVLELVPCRRLRWGRERFLRYGIEAIDALAHRIERAA